VHELSVCQALLRQVTDIAMDRGAGVVDTLRSKRDRSVALSPTCWPVHWILRAGAARPPSIAVIESPAVSFAAPVAAWSRQRRRIASCAPCVANFAHASWQG